MRVAEEGSTGSATVHQRAARGHGDPGTLRLSALGKTWHASLGIIFFFFLHFLLGGNLLWTRRALFSSLSPHATGLHWGSRVSQVLWECTPNAGSVYSIAAHTTDFVLYML